MSLEVDLHSLLTLRLAGGLFTPGERNPGINLYKLSRRLDGFQRQSGHFGKDRSLLKKLGIVPQFRGVARSLEECRVGFRICFGCYVLGNRKQKGTLLMFSVMWCCVA